MKIQKILLLTVFAALFGVCGCSNIDWGKPVEPMCVSGLERQRVASAAEKVLRKMHFSIDKLDPQAGLVSTRPLSGGDFFEFWRRDNADTGLLAFSSLHTVYRTAYITFEGDTGQLCMDCTVRVRRLDLGTEEVEVFSELPGMFSSSGRDLQTLKYSRSAGPETWIDLPNDNLLAQRIIMLIKQQLETGSQQQLANNK